MRKAMLALFVAAVTGLTIAATPQQASADRWDRGRRGWRPYNYYWSDYRPYYRPYYRSYYYSTPRYYYSPGAYYYPSTTYYYPGSYYYPGTYYYRSRGGLDLGPLHLRW